MALLGLLVLALAAVLAIGAVNAAALGSMSWFWLLALLTAAAIGGGKALICQARARGRRTSRS